MVDEGGRRHRFPGSVLQGHGGNLLAEARKGGQGKREAVLAAHKSSVISIITSGLSLFSATVGVALYSNVDMIKAIVVLLARGAIISMVVVIVLLPAMLLAFDKVICYTTVGMKKCAKNT